jgi:hypothetical protein
MNKRQLIEAIQQANPSASNSFLEQFEVTDLMQYLARLEDARARAPRITAWVRPAPRQMLMAC